MGRDGRSITCCPRRMHMHGAAAPATQDGLAFDGLALALDLWTAQSCSAHSDIETAPACQHGLTCMCRCTKYVDVQQYTPVKGSGGFSNLESRI